MLPHEIFEYRFKWLPGYQATLHTDLEMQGTQWCKDALAKQEWDKITFTDIYEHTFCFEDKRDRDLFVERFKDYSKKVN